MSLIGEIIQVSVSPGGMPKWPIPAGEIHTLGIEGDAHAHPRFHGGPRKALLLVSDEDLAELRELGYNVIPGSLGENLTVRGMNFRELRSGMRLQAGAAIVELTTLRVPCRSLDVYNADGKQIQGELFDAKAKAGDPTTPRWARGGFYASVVQAGSVRPGDILKLLDLAV